MKRYCVILIACHIATAGFAATVASDNASSAIYNPGWTTGMNGGTGFGAWQLAVSDTGNASYNGQFIGASTANGNGSDDGTIGGVAGDTDIDSTLSPDNSNVSGLRAWGLYANNGQSATAVRPFTGILTTGQTVRVDFDTGYIQSGGGAGIGLQNSAGQNLWEMFFLGGGSNYVNNDAGGQVATTIPFTDEGVHVDFTLTSATAYRAVISRRDGVSQTITGQLMNPSGGQGVSQFRAFIYNAGTFDPYNMYINNLQIVPASFALPAVTFTAMPANLQIYPRNRQTNRADVPVVGTVNDPGYTNVTLRVYRNGASYTNLTQSSPFSFVVSIPAELANYNFYVSLTNATQEVLVASAANVASGDAFIINGQSNAEAHQWYESSSVNLHPFLRSYDTRTESSAIVMTDRAWHQAEGDAFEGPGAIGQWAMRMGRQLIDTYGIPIAIINGARGGEPISYFQRNDSNIEDLNTNYGRLHYRIRQAGLAGAIRAILWYQGEQENGDGLTHEIGFQHLYEDWLQDYSSAENIYVHQLRAGCGVDQWNVDLRNRQRRWADYFPNFEVMSTTGINNHDGCHFHYPGGYELIGNHIAQLIARDLYNTPQNNVEAINIAYAYFSKPAHNEITLIMRNKADSLAWQSGAEADFRLENSSVGITGGSVASNTVILTLNGDGSNASGITYAGHSGSGPWVLNGSGVGLLAFLNEPIHTSLAPPPVPGGVTATAVSTNLIAVTWNDSDTATGYVVQRDGVPVGSTPVAGFDDFGLAAGTTHCYSIIATGYVGSSSASASACATTFSSPAQFCLGGDYPGYLLANPSMTLYAAVRGTKLYVATWSPGIYPGNIIANDHFIVVSDALTSLQPAFPTWSKAGMIAVDSSKPFLGGESSNEYVGWQNTAASCTAVKSATNAGQMQGTIDLVEAFGYMPETIYLCAAAYTTTNGGPLVAQVPAGNGDGNIDASEFLAIPVASICDTGGDGAFDFFVKKVDAGFTIQWLAIPGKSFQVMTSDSPGGSWTEIGSVLTAGNGQSTLSYTDTGATNAVQRFYKVKRLN